MEKALARPDSDNLWVVLGKEHDQFTCLVMRGLSLVGILICRATPNGTTDAWSAGEIVCRYVPSLRSFTFGRALP